MFLRQQTACIVSFITDNINLPFVQNGSKLVEFSIHIYIYIYLSACEIGVLFNPDDEAHSMSDVLF